MIPFSILDLASVVVGNTPADAFRNTLAMAQQAEAYGFNRYWLAEHHNMPGVASAATSVVIGYVAGGTKTIRVGSGGIMLPNHAPLVIAEQFGTLESLYPGRIDLGLGRAPGSDGYTSRALRRSPAQADDFPQDVLELKNYFADVEPGQRVQAVPGGGLQVPIWILGSSLYGAQLAAMLGLPYAFASHFAPTHLMQAIQTYRTQFRPSDTLAEPYMMVALNVVAADTDVEARRLYTSQQQQFLNIRRGRATQMPPPVDDITRLATPDELYGMESMLSCSVVGSPETVRQGLDRFMAQTQADELIMTMPIYDMKARLHSLALTGEIHRELAHQPA